MNIPYSLRSKFLIICEEAVIAQRDQLNRGISILLGSGGYNGRALVTIRLENQTEFETNWEASDPTRFPIRIKAAATALRNCKCSGTFNISHKDGDLSIRRVL